jgi:archaemetzincin
MNPPPVRATPEGNFKALVRLVPLGPVEDLYTEVVAANLQALMGLNTDILPHRPIFADAFVETRRQYDAVRLIGRLAEAIPGAALCLGLTGSDIGTPILTYVLGESQLGGRVALVSFFRLTAEGPERTLERLAKVSLHEMGHVLGLGHCFAPVCLMRSPRNVDMIDQMQPEFCETCRYEITRRVRLLDQMVQGG